MLLSWRPFSIPHDSILIFWLEEMNTAERCVCDCVHVCVIVCMCVCAEPGDL